jgi:hypothetical protein
MQQTERKHKHAEAFHKMQYRDEVTGEIEWIWNSRDGVTPFVIDSRAGNDANHIKWQEDVYLPDYRPTRGERIFVDATPHLPEVRSAARKYVNEYWDKESKGEAGEIPFPPMREVLTKPSGAQMPKDEAVDFFIVEWTKPGSPWLVEVK